MKAVISVIGQDKVGVLARISGICSECGVNIVDVTQKVLENMFTMIMLVEIDGCKVGFGEFSSKLEAAGNEIGMTVHTMHEDIFNSMHRI